MIKALIFDLDGTLLNSLIDIMDSVNIVLQENNLPVHTLDDYKMFIGNGIEVLAKKALQDKYSHIDFDKFLARVKEIYSKRQILKTKPYDGIIDMLKTLNEQKIKIAILSNKPNEFTQQVVSHFFNDINFDIILGSRNDVPRKPNPQAVFEIIEKLKLEKQQTFFVGDTSTDMQTGKNAGLKTIGVSWGFRSVKELQENGADFIVNKPNEILELIDNEL